MGLHGHGMLLYIENACTGVLKRKDGKEIFKRISMNKVSVRNKKKRLYDRVYFPSEFVKNIIC